MLRRVGGRWLLARRHIDVDEAAGVYGGCGPRLNPEVDPSEWLGRPDGPKAKLANEKPPGETIAYDELIKRWAAN